MTSAEVGKLPRAEYDKLMIESGMAMIGLEKDPKHQGRRRKIPGWRW